MKHHIRSLVLPISVLLLSLCIPVKAEIPTLPLTLELVAEYARQGENQRVDMGMYVAGIRDGTAMLLIVQAEALPYDYHCVLSMPGLEILETLLADSHRAPQESVEAWWTRRLEQRCSHQQISASAP